MRLGCKLSQTVMDSRVASAKCHCLSWRSDTDCTIAEASFTQYTLPLRRIAAAQSLPSLGHEENSLQPSRELSKGALDAIKPPAQSRSEEHLSRKGLAKITWGTPWLRVSRWWPSPHRAEVEGTATEPTAPTRLPSFARIHPEKYPAQRMRGRALWGPKTKNTPSSLVSFVNCTRLSR